MRFLVTFVRTTMRLDHGLLGGTGGGWDFGRLCGNRGRSIVLQAGFYRFPPF